MRFPFAANGKHLTSIIVVILLARRPRRPRRLCHFVAVVVVHRWRHACLLILSLSLRRILSSHRCRFSLSSSLSVAMVAHVIRIFLLAASGQRDYRRHRHHRPRRPRPHYFVLIFIFCIFIFIIFSKMLFWPLGASFGADGS